jgi:tetratricopeptide (TPR) repeat protein
MKSRKPSFIIAFAIFVVLCVSGHYGLVQAQDSAAALSALEGKITADPDNLRLGSDYRQMVIRMGEYDRAIGFYEKLIQNNPNYANAQLNYGFTYVDKVPTAGSITQVLLANNALKAFSKSIELKPSWIAHYTRGNSYLYWPVIFGHAPDAIADLEAAMKLQNGSVLPYYVRTWIALGDGYWKMGDIDKARKTWGDGLKQFPANAALKARLSSDGDDLKVVIDDTYDITKRVDTSLKELFSSDGAAK